MADLLYLTLFQTFGYLTTALCEKGQLHIFFISCEILLLVVSMDPMDTSTPTSPMTDRLKTLSMVADLSTELSVYSTPPKE